MNIDGIGHRSETARMRVFLLSLCLQLLFAIGLFCLYGGEVYIHPDTAGYVAPAMEIRNLGTFSIAGEPEIIRTPGYPLFLALFVNFPHWDKIVIFVQCVMGALIAVYVFVLAGKLWDKNAAVLSAAFFTLSPMTLLYSSSLLTERLMSLLLVIVCVAMFEFVRTKSWTMLTCAAIAQSCTIFTRPSALYMPVGVIIFLMIFCVSRRIGLIRSTAYILLFTAVSLVPVELWARRNERLAGYDGFSAIFGEGTYFGGAAGVLSELENTPYPTISKKLGYGDDGVFFERNPETMGMTKAERYTWLKERGKEIITDNLGTYAFVHAKGMFFTMAMPATGILVRMGWDDDMPGFRKLKEGKSMMGFMVTLLKTMPFTLIILGSSALLLFVCNYSVVDIKPGICPANKPQIFFKTLPHCFTTVPINDAVLA